MVQYKIVVAASLCAFVSAGLLPRYHQIPSSNGFPNPTKDESQQIAMEAGGLLPPNSTLPTALDAESITTFQLIAVNELFESAFFNSLYHNVSTGVDGYQVDDSAHIAEIIRVVAAQESQHALAALATLKSANAFAPTPCRYTFPVANFNDAINFASTFTGLVLGALQGANAVFAQAGLPDIVQLVSAIIGQEGEQNGFYRYLLDRIPSSSPFLTPVPAAYAYSGLLQHIVPKSCHYNSSAINLPVFPAISINGQPIGVLAPRDQTLTLETDLSKSKTAEQYVGGDGSGLSFTYTTGAQAPISVAIRNVEWTGAKLRFQVNFPYSQCVMDCFSHGALTTTDSFASVNDLTNATLAAPALIQVHHKHG